MKNLMRIAVCILALGVSFAPTWVVAEEHPAEQPAVEADAYGPASGEAAVEQHEGAAADHGAGGEGEEHHASMFNTDFVYAVINFLILAGLLVYFLRKPLGGFLAGRRDDVNKALEEAQVAKAKADAALAEYQQKMAGIDAELKQLRDEIASAAAREREQLMAAAQAQVEKIRTDTKVMGEQELRRAKEELREDMIRLAAQIAAKTLATAVSPQDRERELQQFVGKLEAL